VVKLHYLKFCRDHKAKDLSVSAVLVRIRIAGGESRGAEKAKDQLRCAASAVAIQIGLKDQWALVSESSKVKLTA